MELEGKVIAVLPMESGVSKAGKSWSKASVIIETPGQYPKKVKLSNMKNADAFSQLAPGTTYIFHVEVESREWTNQTTGKTSWFTEVNAWKWESPQPAGTPPVSTPPRNPVGADPQVKPAPEGVDGDNLPF